MPELPEVESVRRQLAPRLEGRRVVALWADHQARFGGLDQAVGGQITALRRRGKYLIAALDHPLAEGGLELVMHLGMTGSFRVRGDPLPVTVDREAGDVWDGDAYVRATITLDDAVVDFRDVRRFGRLTVVPAGEYATIPTLAHLGPEPLSPEFTATGFHRALAASTMEVKALLLTQRPVAGVGNIYADEALWEARIHPRSRRVGARRATALWRAIRVVLTAAIEREGTTFRDYQMVNGASGRYAEFLAAYGQAGRPCARCGTPLRKAIVGGRGTTYCARCQRR